MISEKTVELNLTTELVNWLYVTSGTRPYIIAPSQREEATLGFDASIGFPSGSAPTLIQYKRAYFKSRTKELEYHLNRNATQDQHLRLLCMELKGWDVYYALPLFYTPTEVVNFRQKLLKKTIYIRPSWIAPIGSWTGHHEVRYNLTTKRITVHSDEGNDVTNYLEIGEFADHVTESFENVHDNNKQTELFIDDYNSVFATKEKLQLNDITIPVVSQDDFDLTKGQIVLLF